MVESSIVIYKKILIDYQQGSRGEVEFDFAKVWNFYKKNKHSFDFMSLQFFHVHPFNIFSESEKDINCMKGFAQAFNKRIPFHIVIFKDNNIMNLDCAVLTLIYDPKTEEIEKIFNYNFRYQDNNFLVLKLLSFGNFPREVDKLSKNLMKTYTIL